MAAAAAPLVLGGHVAFSALVGSPCGGLLDGGKAAEFAVLAIGQVCACDMILGGALFSRFFSMMRACAWIGLDCIGEESQCFVFSARQAGLPSFSVGSRPCFGLTIATI